GMLVPTLMYRLLELEEARSRDLSSLRAIIYGAAPMSPDKLELLKGRFGNMGELWLRSRGTINGYFRNPEATASEFCNGFWKSGDLGYRDAQGYVYIVDRKKD